VRMTGTRLNTSLILVVLVLLGIFSISYIQNQEFPTAVGDISRNPDVIEFKQTSEFVQVDLTDENGQPTRGYLDFAGKIQHLASTETTTILFTLVGRNDKREVVELPVVLDAKGRLNIGGLTGGGSAEAVPLPLGERSFRVTINSDLVVRVLVGDATAIARSGLLTGLGIDELTAFVLEPSIAKSRFVDGLSSIRGTYFPSPKRPGSGMVSSVTWLLFIALVFLVFVNVQRKLRPVTSPIRGTNVRQFLATAALISFIATGVGIVVMLLGGRSPFLEPAISSMSDWLDTLAASSADPYVLAQSAYPPASYAILKFVPFNLGLTFFLCLAGVAIGILWGTVGTLTRFSNKFYGYIPGIILSACFSVWFALDRGNTDLIICGAIAGFFGWSLCAPSPLPAFLSGIVASLKWFTLPVSILGLKDRNTRGLPLFTLIVIAFVLANFMAVFVGSFQTDDILSLFSGGKSLIDVPLEYKLNYSISISSWLYLLAKQFSPVSNQNINEFFTNSLVNYTIPLILIFILFIFLWRGNLDRWRTSTIMATGICLFPPVSYIYKTILLVACLTLISKISRDIYRPALSGVLFALFVSAPTFLSFQGVTIATWISVPVGVGLAFTLSMSREGPKDRALTT
jgi:hypothetical protein